MAKDKSTKKAAAPAKTETVKSGRVAKPAEAPKKVAKDTAKNAAKAIEKKKKKAKEPTPEPESESESESESEADDATSQSSDSSDSDSDEEVPAPKTNGAAKAAKEADSDDDSDDDDSESESEEEKVAAPKANGVNGKAKAEDSDDSESDSESDEEEEPAKAAETDDSDDESDSDDSDDEEEEEEAKPAVEEKSNKKRKADSAVEATPKRAKVMVDGEEKEPVANLFIGQLSWNVDEEWLTREFEGFGEIAGVRIITDRDSGRSKGYGYVEFVEVDSAIKALEEMSGKELDGRALRVDFSAPRAARDNNSTPQQRSNDRAQKYGDSTKEPTSTLWVGNISFDADENTLTEAFQPYGTIKAIRLPTDRDTGAPKGFGYIEMESLEDAKSAFASCQGMEVAGRALRLDYAGERSNDSAGGGFGGGRGGRGGGRGRGGDRGRGGFGRGGGGRGGGFGGRGGKPNGTNRGGFGDFSGKKTTF